MALQISPVEISKNCVWSILYIKYLDILHERVNAMFQLFLM